MHGDALSCHMNTHSLSLNRNLLLFSLFFSKRSWCTTQEYNLFFGIYYVKLVILEKVIKVKGDFIFIHEFQ